MANTKTRRETAIAEAHADRVAEAREWQTFLATLRNINPRLAAMAEADPRIMNRCH